MGVKYSYWCTIWAKGFWGEEINLIEHRTHDEIVKILQKICDEVNQYEENTIKLNFKIITDNNKHHSEVLFVEEKK